MGNPFDLFSQNLSDKGAAVHVAGKSDCVECCCQIRGDKATQFCLFGCHLLPRLEAGLQNRSGWVKIGDLALALGQQLKKNRDKSNDENGSDAVIAFGEGVHSKEGEASSEGETYDLGHSGFLDGLEQFTGNLFPLSKKRRNDPISDAYRQPLRPLRDGLIGNAECFCGGMRGASEKFYGFCLEHGVLNHSSPERATIVFEGQVCSGAMVDYKERLAEALKARAVSEHQLASSLKVSIQAVRKVLAGGSAAFSAENNSKAARFLRVDSDWLATGEGPMVSSREWPFPTLTPEQVSQLSPESLALVQKLALDLSEIDKLRSVSDVSYAQNGLPRSRRAVTLELETKKTNNGKRDSATKQQPGSRQRSGGAAG